MKEYFWNLFEHTGSIDAYLAYKDMANARRNGETGDMNEHSESQGHSYRG